MPINTPTMWGMNQPTILLTVYAGAAFLASLMGGSIPSWLRLNHIRLQLALSFIGGLMLGMALLQLIPHAVGETHSVDRTVAWVLGGFLAMFFLQRMFHPHQHGTPGDWGSESANLAGGERAVPSALPSATPNAPVPSMSWVAVALGVAFHSLVDGLALAAAVMIESRADAGWLGLGIALPVILHKPFDALAVLTLMHASGCPAAWKRALNAGLALVVPLGAGLALMGLHATVETKHEFLGYALGFCGGGFLCIAGSDLLPELRFHSHDRLRLSLALLAGVGIAILLSAFAEHGHGCHHVHPHHSHNLHQPSDPGGIVPTLGNQP